MLDLQMDVLKTSKKKYAITTTEVKELTPDARCVLKELLRKITSVDCCWFQLLSL